MKENPRDKKIQKNLRPGEFSLKGFLGKDKRNFSEIIEVDRANLNKLGYNCQEVADRMDDFTNQAFESFDGSIIIEDIYQVSYDTYRGKLICPFMHSGAFRKGLITLKNLQKNLTIQWTPLNVHIIHDHCFFQGIGSVHRIEPKDLIEAIF